MSSANPIGSPFIELHSVDSTNNYAMGIIHAGMAQHGMCVFAHEQIHGRGQRNKAWHSQKGCSITLSIILQPDGLAPSQLFLLSMAMAIATKNFFNRLAGGDTRIKWPNDIYWRDRKAAGILIENILQGNKWKYAIAGIGININQSSFEELQTKAVSLKQITGKDHTPVLLAKELCQYVDQQFNRLNTQPEAILKEYQASLYKLNETVRFKNTTRIFDAEVKKVTRAGQLVVMHAVEESFDVGEVEWLIQ